MITVTDEQLNRLGELADNADNYFSASTLPMPDKFHKEQLAQGMKDLSTDIKALFAEITGINPWK